jgi:tetratricopeptide (TPR) repeat protein
VATAAWRRFVEIAARRGDATAAAQALVAWADDPRTAEDERARAIHLVAAAEIFRERLGLVEDAVALLERAISLAPRDEAAFEALETLATRTGDWPRLAELLARRAELVRPAERNALWGRLGALLAGKLAREEDAARLYQRLLDAEPGHPEALLFIARFAWKQGGQARSAEHYQRLLEAGGDGRQRAEAHLRLAQWAAVGGALAEARQHADQALAGEPEEGAPAEVLVAALEALGQGEELVERLARRETRAGEPRAPGGSEEPRSELARLRAGVLDRLGGARSEEAVQIYQELLAADGSAPLALLGLARIFRRQERWPELLSVLERLWAGERMTPIDVEAVGLELASVLAQQAGQPERAEAILRELVVRSPGWLARVEGAGGAAPLPAEMQARIHFTLGQVAERDGDLPSALEHFEAALSSGSSPKERARHLLGHARVRLLGKEVEDARTDLAEALDLVPEYAPALALLADLAYRNQDWPEARRLYTRLAAAPDVAQAIAADLLLFRRALLAEAGGDDVEAEAAYRALCALDPAHCEAREGLAQIAFLRGDLPEAARLLEEVLRLRSPEARERIRAARQRLGEIYFRMHDYAAARPLLEQVLAEQPDHGEGIGEALVAVYQRLGLDAEASALHARLARIHPRLEQRPDALARLVPYYWSRGDFTGLCEVGEELQRIPGPGPLSRRELALTVALGTAMAGQDTETAARILLRTTTTTTTAAGGAEAGPGEGPRIEAEEVAARLADLGTRLSGRDVKGLDPALDLLARAVPGSLGPSLLRALGRRAMAPAAGRDPGALVALGRVAERRGNRALARVAYGVLCSVDPASPAGARLAALGPGGAVRPEGFAPGAVDHPAVRGPLRRVLRALCRPLAGLGRISARSKVTGMGVPAEAAARLEELRGKLDAPPVRAVFQTEVTGAVALGTRPVTIALGPGVMELPPEEAAFVMARALEDARAGTFLARALDGEPSDDDLSHLLAAVRACLGGGAGGASELDRTVAGWLAEPETAALLPAGTGMVQLLADLDEVASGPVDLGAYLRGCRLTADRVGLLACGSPAVALRVLASETDAAGAESARELIAFLLSPEYAGLMGELAVER